MCYSPHLLSAQHHIRTCVQLVTHTCYHTGFKTALYKHSSMQPWASCLCTSVSVTRIWYWHKLGSKRTLGFVQCQLKGASEGNESLCEVHSGKRNLSLFTMTMQDHTGGSTTAVKHYNAPAALSGFQLTIHVLETTISVSGG